VWSFPYRTRAVANLERVLTCVMKRSSDSRASTARPSTCRVFLLVFLCYRTIPTVTLNQLLLGYRDIILNAYSNANHRTYDRTIITVTYCSGTCALYLFEPIEPGGLAFESGGIIQVVDREYNLYKDGRGQLGGGHTGIPRSTMSCARLLPLPFLVVSRDLFRDPPRQSCQLRRSRRLQCSFRWPTSTDGWRCSALWTPPRIILPQ